MHGGLAEGRAAVGQSLDEPLIHGRGAVRPLGVRGQEPADRAGYGPRRGALLAHLQPLSTHRGVGGPRGGHAVADRVYRVLRHLPAHRGHGELEGPGPVLRIDAHPFRGLAHDLDLETLLRSLLAETLARAAHRVEVGHGDAQQLPEIGPHGRCSDPSSPPESPPRRRRPPRSATASAPPSRHRDRRTWRSPCGPPGACTRTALPHPARRCRRPGWSPPPRRWPPGDRPRSPQAGSCRWLRRLRPRPL